MDWDQGTEQTATPVCSDNWNWNSLAHQLIRIQGQHTQEPTGGGGGGASKLCTKATLYLEKVQGVDTVP